MKTTPATPPLLLLLLISLLCLAPIASHAEPGELRLMTYNLRLELPSDGPNNWPHRRQQLAAQIAFHQPDILGVQEALYPQVAYLAENLAGYRYLGIGRDDGHQAGEHAAIFYREDRAEPLASSTFWLSETPDTPSFGWGAQYRRICTYARFRDRASGQTYWIFNTHFDHQVEPARLNGAHLILERIGALVAPGEPYFLMGDLNATPDQPPIQPIAAALLDSRLHSASAPFGSEGTYNDFLPAELPTRRIDYIFASPHGVSITNYATLSDLVDGRYLSDHFPVLVNARIQTPQAPFLRVSDNQRHLVDQSGQPFLWLGDTAWELFHRLDRDQALLYLQTRAAQGFNLVQAVALAETNGLTTPNAYGHLPLLEQDPARPNEPYFEHVDWIVQQANALGIVVGLLPTWGDKFNKKWGVGPEVFTPENARAFGRFMGQRYHDDSIVWILGGDRIPEEEDDFRIVAAMAAGLAEGDGGRHLMTYHPQGRQRSSRFFHDADWLDINMHQSGHSDESYPNFNDTLADYNLSPVKPTLDGEPCYEDHLINWKPELGWFDAFDSRRAGYWSMLSGALGHTYGHHAVWQMWQPGRHPITSVRTPWQQAIHYPGAHQAGYMRRAFESIDWTSLAPAQNLLAQGPSEPEKSIRVAANADTSLIVAYTPFGSPFALTLPLAPGQNWSARWFNPTNAASIPFALNPTEAPTPFDPPADEKRANDWLLILSRP